MKLTLSHLALVAVAVVAPSMAAAQSHAYVGVKGCTMCHKSEKQGLQGPIWEKSKHAEAFAALSSPKAAEIAKAKGIANAAEAKECLACHVLSGDVGAADPKQGVQCESCHGAGADYKSMAVMKDKTKASAAGLKLFADKAAAEAMCKTCHNEKSPTFKSFNYDEYWGKIAHKKPAA